MIIINNIENGNIDNILSNYDNFNSFVSSLTKEPYDILHKLFLISFYLYGPYLYSEDYGYNLNLFIYRNLPEFPQESYIEKDQYFMMGDNRYNSFDNRFNGIIQNKMDRYYLEILDKDDNTFFSTKVIVDWHPRTISLSHVLGKAKVIYWPPERFKIFK